MSDIEDANRALAWEAAGLDRVAARYDELDCHAVAARLRRARAVLAEPMTATEVERVACTHSGGRYADPEYGTTFCRNCHAQLTSPVNGGGR